MTVTVFDKENQLKKLEEAKKLSWLRLDLQHFGDDGGDDGGDKGGAGGDDKGGTGKGDDKGGDDKKTFTQAEIDAQISKAVDTALKRQRAKLDQEIADRIENERKEAERLAKLSENERKDEEMKKREKDIADRLAELERKELKADAISDLNQKGLPSEFADFLLAEDAEKTLENINAFKEAFDKAVNEAVKEKLRQDTPKLGGNKLSGGKVPSVAELAQKHRLIK